MLRYKELAIADYGFALKCLTYESLQLVQNLGYNLSFEPVSICGKLSKVESDNQPPVPTDTSPQDLQNRIRISHY
jgi:hypothetical protein